MDKKVLATVGTRRITEEDVNAFLRSLDEETAKNLNTPEGKKQVVRELVNRELFYLEALSRGLDEDEEYLDQVESAKEMLLKQYAINSYVDDVSVSDEEVEQYYNTHKDEFVSPPGVRASHILVDNELNARKVLKEIQSGLLFAEAAKKYSNCPSKSKGGDLGFLEKGRVVPEFEKAAFRLEIGEMSGPVKTRYGYHIIKVTDKKSETQRPLDEVKDAVKQHILMQKRQERYKEKANELRKEYIVKVNKN